MQSQAEAPQGMLWRQSCLPLPLALGTPGLAWLAQGSSSTRAQHRAPSVAAGTSGRGDLAPAWPQVPALCLPSETPQWAPTPSALSTSGVLTLSPLPKSQSAGQTSLGMVWGCCGYCCGRTSPAEPASIALAPRRGCREQGQSREGPSPEGVAVGSWAPLGGLDLGRGLQLCLLPPEGG